MAQATVEVTDELLETVDTISFDDDEVLDFAESALEKAIKMLESNFNEAKGFMDVEGTVEEVMDPENIHEVQIRARKFENPRVTVWLSDCPSWANTASQTYIYPNGINAYNGKVNLTIDIRPF